MKYDAFISYRHAKLDMEIAKKVHTALESFKVPIPVQKKTGKKKIRRVFRDQEELPIGSNLDDNIRSALYESEYLIIICSPRTMGSEWVMKEIDTFISMHGRQNILAILVEGEPDESFPKQILVDDYGNEVEPLAADVRGANAKERNEKFKTEIMRLAAPILGCTYDDLRQRHRERKIRKTFGTVAAIAGATAIAGAGFGIYSYINAQKMKELAEEKTRYAEEVVELSDKERVARFEAQSNYREQLRIQSGFLATTALNLFDYGDREDAALVAYEALSLEETYDYYDGVDYDEYGADDRVVYTEEAEYALSKILYAYANGDEIGCDRLLRSDTVLTGMVSNNDSTVIAAIDNNNALYV